MLNINITTLQVKHRRKNGVNKLQYRYVHARIGVSLSFGLVFLFGGASAGSISRWVGLDSNAFPNLMTRLLRFYSRHWMSSLMNASR
jgi:hypothetical protein